MLHFIKHLLQLIISPTNGWEDISHKGSDAKRLASEGLYPLLGIAAISTFIRFFYDNDLTLISLIQHSIVVFVQFFVTYFIALFTFSLHLGKLIEGEINEKRSMTYITYSIAVLAFIKIIENCIPINFSLMEFLPIYAAIIMWRGDRYMAVKKEKQGFFITLFIFSIIVPPYLINYLFNLVF